MKKIFICMLMSVSISALAQTVPVGIKEILLDKLATTHTKKEWFVPVNIALEGLTPEQAIWTDGSGNHSIAQLATHLVFWNQRVLAKFNGEKEAAFNGNNDETFSSVDKAKWAEIVKQVDNVLTAWENAIKAADETKLKEWYSTIANISTHNAYHTGQIIYTRKLQGSWDAEKGVK